MSDLRFNTILGTGLAAALLIMGLQQGAHTLFHPHMEKEPAIPLEVEKGGGGGAAPAEAEAGPPDFGSLFADPAGLAALIEKGDKVHKVCVSCHNAEKGGGNKTGPELWNVFGRTAGTHAGFNYSDAMKAYGKPWDYTNLYDYLAAPAKYVKGTSMSFAGIRKSDDRVALVAYLRSINDNPNPALPAPLPQAPPSADPAAAPVEGAAPAEAAPAAPAPG